MPISTIDTTTPHQATVALTGMRPVAREYTSPDGLAGTWGTADGWAVGAGATLSVLGSGLVVAVTGTSSYIQRAVTSTAVDPPTRRVRALVVLDDPEARPVRAWISDNSGTYGQPPDHDDSPDWSRVVGGTPVWVEGWIPRNGPTHARVNIAKAVGSTSSTVRVLQVVIDTVYEESWKLTATDANGTRVLASHLSVDVPASGAVAIVDREASLVGATTWTLTGFAPTSTLAATLTSTGWAVLGRVHAPTDPLHQVFLVSFGGNYQAQAEALPILGAELPNVPTAPFGSRQGSLTLYFDTLDAAELVAASLRTGDVHQLRQPAAGRTAMDAYLVANSVDVQVVLEELTEPKWALTVGYVETARGGVVRG